MKAFTLDALDTSPTLRDDLPDPTPAANEVLVRVHASSVNPVDAGIAGGMLAQMFEYEFPVTLGRDYAGVVERAGADVTRYAVGDEVYGFLLHANPNVHDGSWAELITVPEDNSIARKPAGVDVATAGAASLAGIAALLSVDALALSAGETALVVGGPRAPPRRCRHAARPRLLRARRFRRRPQGRCPCRFPQRSRRRRPRPHQRDGHPEPGEPGTRRAAARQRDP